MPWVNDDTVYVAIGSVDGIDLDAAGKWITSTAAQAVDPSEVESTKRSIAQGITLARGLREQLKAAGVKEVYVLFEATPQHGVQLLCAIPAGANADALAANLRPLVGRIKVTVEQGAAIIHISGRMAERRPRADRPDLAAALAGRDAPVVLAFSLPQELRNAMPAELPKQMGGAELLPIHDGFMWGAAELRFTPEPAIHALAQMDGADNALKAVKVLRSVMQAEAKRGRGEAEVFATAGKLLMPQAKDDTLVIDLPTAKLNEALAQLAPSLREARQHAKQISSASQMRQLLLALMMYANDNKGAMPEQLQQLDKYLGRSMQQMMTNPQRPEKSPGYIYLKQPLKGSTEKVMLYEAYDNWPGGINVGYPDGHVEWIDNEATFLAQLKASGGAK